MLIIKKARRFFRPYGSPFGSVPGGPNTADDDDMQIRGVGIITPARERKEWSGSFVHSLDANRKPDNNMLLDHSIGPEFKKIVCLTWVS